MFDLTKQIVLDAKLQKKYSQARILLHAIFIFGLIFTAYRILFPSQSLDLFFDNINSTKNTIVNPLLTNGKVPPKGLVGLKDTFTFNANPLGNFSSVTISLKTDNDYSAENAIFFTRKSYQAFFYPIGEPVGFKNGTLLTTPDGNYYIVSNGILRRFSNTNIILEFGFPKNSFLAVAADDLQYNTIGPDITSSNTYPDDSLFVIDNKYYQIKNGQLLSFISDRAFLSQYQGAQAITKNIDFFSNYPASEASIGFSNGTLASAGGSVFILSNGRSFPIADFNTFLVMGFSWDNVVALESDELGSYIQQKQFTIDQPHPDGILFTDKLANTNYIIDNGKKRPILSNEVLKTFSNKQAVFVDEKGSEKKLTCTLEKNFFSSNTFSCAMPLDEVSNVLGNDYRIESKFGSETKIKQVNLNFSTPLKWSNLRLSLSKIKDNLKNNYTRIEN